MIQLSDFELQKKQILKALRANIRLKYSLLADEELNQKLPEIERQIDEALAAGVQYHLDLESALQ